MAEEENKSSYRNAYIYIQNIYAGILSEADNGYIFTYDKDYLQNPDAKPVSLTLPLQKEVYESKTLFPFFDGLIPEGWLLNVVSKNWKIDRKDRFGLLMAVCKDSIGDVSVRVERGDL